MAEERANGIKAAFDLRQKNKLRWETFLSEDSFHHVSIENRTLASSLEILLAGSLKVADEAMDLLIKTLLQQGHTGGTVCVVERPDQGLLQFVFEFVLKLLQGNPRGIQFPSGFYSRSVSSGCLGTNSKG